MTASPPSASIARRLRFLLIGGLLACACTIAALPTLLGALFIGGLMTFSGGCGERDPASLGLPAESITFSTADGDARAWFIPTENTQNAPTVIAMPTGRSGRGDRLETLAILHAAGANVFTFDSRACVPGRRDSLGWHEADRAPDALLYLQSRGGLALDRLVVYGFSAGGAAALYALDRSAAIGAAIVEGAYHDFASNLQANSRSLGVLGGLFEFGGRAFYQVSIGEPLAALRPIDAVRTTTPRPLLLIYGTLEPGLDGARDMAALREGVTLVEIVGSGHGGYLAADGEAYTEALTAFIRAR